MSDADLVRIDAAASQRLDQGSHAGHPVVGKRSRSAVTIARSTSPNVEVDDRQVVERPHHHAEKAVRRRDRLPGEPRDEIRVQAAGREHTGATGRDAQQVGVAAR